MDFIWIEGNMIGEEQVATIATSCTDKCDWPKEKYSDTLEAMVQLPTSEEEVMDVGVDNGNAGDLFPHYTCFGLEDRWPI